VIPRRRPPRPAIAALAATLLAATWPGLAVPASAQEPEVVGDAVTGFGALDWFGLGLRLALVVAVIWGVVWAMRWYVRRMNGGPAGSGRLLHVVETRALGPNRSLQLVRLGDHAVLLGVTPDRINALLSLDDPDEVERLTEVAEQPAAVSGVVDAAIARLGGSLARFGGRRGSPRPAAAPADAAPPSPPPALARPDDGPLAPAAGLDNTPPSAQRLQAAGSYRRARVAELQRAIERARGAQTEGAPR
jgi:flagellar biosynthetic protein FliO